MVGPKKLRRTVPELLTKQPEAARLILTLLQLLDTLNLANHVG